jgi:hypothetical protein
MTQVLDVWNEVRITSDGISITLLSERADGGAVVEDETWFTFDELTAESPSRPMTLNLSDETSEAIAEANEQARIGQMKAADGLAERAEILSENPSADELLAYMGLSSESEIEQVADEFGRLTAGDAAIDENAPSWSDDEQVIVLERLDDVTAEEYVIQGNNEGKALPPREQAWSDKTVATANPSYPDDDTVILARYIGGDKEYAVPESRLSAQ